MGATKWLAQAEIRDYALSEFSDHQHADPHNPCKTVIPETSAIM